MADAATLKLQIEVSKTGEAPRAQSWSQTFAPDEGLGGLFVQATTTGTTVSLAAFSSVDAIVIRNRSSTAAEAVTATYVHTKESVVFAASAIEYVIGANVYEITDTGSTFVTNGFVGASDVRITGSSDSGNNTTFAVMAVRADALELAFGETPNLVTDTGTPTLRCDVTNYAGVPAGGMHLTESVYPGGNLVLTSDEGTPTCDVWVLGS